MEEGLQWFFSTTADLPEGRSAMGGGEVCNITPALVVMFISFVENVRAYMGTRKKPNLRRQIPSYCCTSGFLGSAGLLPQ